MATYSNFLGLKLNAPSDPFLLSDFITNWSILDGSPGSFICTSLSRPTWGSSQAGMKIFMTDYKQDQFWTGSTFQDPLNSVPVFAGGSFLDLSMTRNNNYSPNILQFTTSRPAALGIMAVATYNCNNQQTQDAWQSISFDGQTNNLGGFREQIRFAGNNSDASGTAGVACASIGIAASVAAGLHHVGLVINIGSNSTSLTLVGVKVLAFVGQYSTSNSL